MLVDTATLPNGITVSDRELRQKHRAETGAGRERESKMRLRVETEREEKSARDRGSSIDKVF